MSKLSDLAKLNAVSDETLQAEFNRLRRQAIVTRIAKEFQVPWPLAEARLEGLRLIEPHR